MRSGLVRAACLAIAVSSGATAGAQTPAQAAPRVLVVPFENQKGDARTFWLREASAILVADHLAALGVAVINRDDRVRAFDRLRVPGVASLSHATVIRLGQVVGAALVVVGSFELEKDELAVRARVIQLDTGHMRPEIAERGALGEIFGTYGRAARRLAGPTAVAGQAAPQFPSLPAFEQYVKGLVAEAATAKVSFLTQALQLSPSLHRARLALWDVHTEQDNDQAALAAVLGVPADHALFRQARFRGAVSLLGIGMLGEAHARLTELNTVAADPALLNNLGVVQLRRPAGSPGGAAVDFFREAARLDAGDADLYFNLGYAHWLQRDAASAIPALREAVRRNPADGEAHYVLGVALQAAGGGAEALREKELARQLSSVFTEWEKSPPGQPAIDGVPRGLERVKTEVDVPASMRVESVIVAAEQRDQRQLATFHLDSGRRLFQSDRDVEAIAELRRAIYLSPYQSEAHLLLGRIYLRGGRLQEAVNALKISIWSEDSVAAHLVLADAYIAGRENAAARRELETVLKREPQNAEARRLLARLQ